MNMTTTMATIKRIVRSYSDRIDLAYLFGSAARGDATAASDLDLAIRCIGKNSLEYFDIKLDLAADLCRALGRNDVDILILNTANTILRDEVVRQGVLLYEQNPDDRTLFEVNVLHQALDFKARRLALCGH